MSQLEKKTLTFDSLQTTNKYNDQIKIFNFDEFIKRI